MKKEAHFSPELFKFLHELKKNNNREWFQANKARYESLVRDPFLRFIADLVPHFYNFSLHIVADARPTGGSLFRIYRDTRFSKDKSPYKTHAAAHFRHRDAGKNVHTPGFYLHLEPGSCFTAAGIWHPDSPTLTKIRTAIVEQSNPWAALRRRVSLEGEKLARPPKGFDCEHPFIEDLKHKDFITSVTFSEKQVCQPRFILDFTAACKQMGPLVKFLAEALGLPW
jgi:uncharacterized protein (TIGR02453 family)